MDFPFQKTKLIEGKVCGVEERITDLHEIKEGEYFINRSHEVLHKGAEIGQRDNSGQIP